MGLWPMLRPSARARGPCHENSSQPFRRTNRCMHAIDVLQVRRQFLFQPLTRIRQIHPNIRFGNPKHLRRIRNAHVLISNQHQHFALSGRQRRNAPRDQSAQLLSTQSGRWIDRSNIVNLLVPGSVSCALNRSRKQFTMIWKSQVVNFDRDAKPPQRHRSQDGVVEHILSQMRIAGQADRKAQCAADRFSNKSRSKLSRLYSSSPAKYNLIVLHVRRPRGRNVKRKWRFLPPRSKFCHS